MKHKGSPVPTGGKSGNGKSSGGPIELIKGIRSEWTKITWPTWPQIWGQTIVVLVMVAITSVGLWVIDKTLRFVIGFITQLGS